MSAVFLATPYTFHCRSGRKVRSTCLERDRSSCFSGEIRFTHESGEIRSFTGYYDTIFSSYEAICASSPTGSYMPTVRDSNPRR